MSKMKKFASLLLALALVFALGVSAYAASDYIITVSNSVTDSTYTAYKIFDATYNTSGTTYYITADSEWYEDVTGDGSPFTVASTPDSEGRYQVTVDSTVSATTIASWIAAHLEGKNTAATGTGNGGALALDVGSAGYYYITTTTGSGTVTLDTANPTATVIDKNTSSGGLNKTVGDSTVAIGDTVMYTVTASVPLHSDGVLVTNYTITDTLEAGLDLDDTSVEVVIYDASGAATSISITAAVSDNTITVTFNPSAIDSYPENATIKITYSATVLSTATNSNMGNHVVFGDESKDVDLTTFDFDLTKTDSTSTTISGAEFTLSEGTSAITFVELTDASGNVTGYRVATTDEISGGNTTTTIKAGSVNIYGLDAGTYTLTETKAPDGYNLLTSSITVEISEAGEVTVTGTNGSATGTDVTVVNNAGSELPSTGGIGTTIFYVIGSIMVLGAVVLLITRKRMSKAE